MNVYLLYPDRDWNNIGRYFDDKAIVQDLGLETLFLAAAKEVEMEDGKVKFIHEADPALQDAMKKVMLVPLETEEEILFRQEIVKDCLAREELIRQLYEISSQVLVKWEKLGRRAGAKVGMRNSPRTLITEIHVLQLFVNTLKQIKKLLADNREHLHSAGFISLYERLCVEFSDEMEANLDKILQDVAFFANENEHDEMLMGRMVNKPKIVLGCSIGAGLKPEGFCLEEISTEVRRHRDPNSAIGRAQEYISSLTTDSFSVQKGMSLLTQVAEMEYRIVQYVISYCEPFVNSFNSFFDQLHLQAAFYRGILNLKQYMDRFFIHSCYPKVSAKRDLRFRELKEVVMGIEQRISPVGNSCHINDKELLIVTGANQGGKSTFLRSIGIAQIMMQSGLPVAAESYESGIYPSFFTHFTRREDSEMNSGRLDEELSRMSRIIDNLGDSTMVLLNESFASTTEKEGSVIAYDIIKAMTEVGVKVLTVTHLLSFAQRVYEESDAKVEFFSAQRLENGKRTFKMIQHAPELTSFGLDLYDEIITAKK